MRLLEQEPLSRHTTLRTGGPARFFAECVSEADLRAAIAFARERKLPLRILGGGSNVLAPDAGFDGVVVHVATRGIQARPISPERIEVAAAAGEEWDALVRFAIEQDLGGLENLSLIPGTVGGAVVGNIGAYGAEVKDGLLWAEALDLNRGTTRRFAAAECGFAYRSSFFKTARGRHFLVTRAAFALRRPAVVNTRYRDLAEYFAERGVATPTVAAVREAVVAIRRRKLPDVAVVGTAGSFFKNPVIARRDYEALVARFPGLPAYEEGRGRVKIPLGWILDKVCGLKGVRRGRVGTHPTQALVIVNEGGTAVEIECLAREMAACVRERTGLVVEWEVEKL